MAVRSFLIKKLKEFLANGELKSKYFYKFEILDVISPKCFVVRPKTRSVQSNNDLHVSFIFKQLNAESIVTYCGTPTPSTA